MYFLARIAVLSGKEVRWVCGMCAVTPSWLSWEMDSWRNDREACFGICCLCQFHLKDTSHKADASLCFIRSFINYTSIRSTKCPPCLQKTHNMQVYIILEKEAGVPNDLNEWLNSEELKNLLHKDGITLLEIKQPWLHQGSQWLLPINRLLSLEGKFIKRLSRLNFFL